MKAINILRAIITGVVVTLGVWYFLHETIFGSWEAENKKKQEDAEKLERENAKMAELEKRREEVLAEQARLEAAIRELQPRLPNQEQFGQIIQDFTAAARERQLTLFIQARPPLKREGVQSGSLQFSVESISEGGYQRIRSFADWIRDYPRLISFQRFETSVGTDGKIGLNGNCQTPVMFDILLPPAPEGTDKTGTAPEASPKP